MATVSLTPAQLRQAQANLKRNAGPRGAKLYQQLPPKQATRAQALRSRASGAAGNVRRVSGAASPAIQRTGRVVRSKPVRRAVQSAPGRMGTGFLTALIGAGILIAIIRNPKLITLPLSFLGTLTGAVNKVFGGTSNASGFHSTVM